MAGAYMGVISDSAQRALKYWGVILASARENLPIAGMWDAIRADAQQHGLDNAGASASDVMVLRGYANRLVNAANAINEAAPGQSITAEMMSVAPYSDRSYASINTDPLYQARFLNRIQTPSGDVVDRWQTSIFSAADMPSTVGDLNAMLQFNAQQLAESGSANSEKTPKGTSLGISDISVVVV